MRSRLYDFVKVVIFLLITVCFFTLPGQAAIKRIPILIYHGVRDKTFGMEELFIRQAEFEKQMRYLHDNHYTPLTFEDINHADQYRKPVFITFDDGYDDNFTNAYPVLKKYQLKATIFMISGYIDFPEYLTTEQIKKMSDIVSFQSHTYSHPKLTQVSSEVMRTEFVKSKDMIEALTKKPVFVLSYPYGDYNTKVAAEASKYYRLCVTTDKGYYYKDSTNPYKLRRLYILRQDTLSSFITKVQ